MTHVDQMATGGQDRTAPGTHVLPSRFLSTLVDLGTAGNYAILSKVGISTVPDSDITGNIAVSPIAGTAMTGFSVTAALSGTAATSSQVSGFLYGASYGGDTPAILTQAILDMEAAYTNASSRTNSDPLRNNLKGGILDGEKLTPGVYTFTTVIDIQGDITFCGRPNDVFIIQTTGTLSISVSGKKVLLDCGARAENIFWQAAGAVTVATYAHMEGNILGFTSVSMMTGSSVNGIIHAQTAVVLQKATVNQPSDSERPSPSPSLSHEPSLQPSTSPSDEPSLLPSDKVCRCFDCINCLYNTVRHITNISSQLKLKPSLLPSNAPSLLPSNEVNSRMQLTMTFSPIHTNFSHLSF